MEIETITSSYTRKINHSLYGGGAYESSDHFCSMSASVEVGEDVQKAEKELHTMCMEMVNNHVLDEVSSFAGGITADKFYTYIRDMVARRPIDGEVYQACNKAQKAILQAVKRGLQMNKRDNSSPDKKHHSLQKKDSK